MKTHIMFNILNLLFCSFSIHIYSQDLTPEQVFEKCNDAVVVITAFDFEGKKNAQGSGVILNSKRIILTNYHIFAGNDKIEIKHKDNVINYTAIVGVNIEKDILILKIDQGTYPEISMADLDNMKIGQKVYAIGSPMGLENSISDGIISGVRELGKSTKKKYIQITASLSPGSSGGAVLNANGELIGISTMSYEEGQNLNFAIPVDEILKVMSGDYLSKDKLESLTYFYKGYNAEENGDHKEAIKDYDKYIEANPKDPKAYNYRGIAYFKLKNYEKAIADYSKALNLNPALVSSINNRGEAYFKLEDYDKAAKDFTKAIQLDPDNVSAYYSRGLTYSKDDKHDKAVKDFTKAIELEPGFAYSYINRGFSYYAMEEYEYAIRDWEKAIKLDPSFERDLRPYINYANLKDAIR